MTNKPDPVDPVDEIAKRIAEAITCICGAGIEGHRRACIVNHREDVRRIAARILREAELPTSRAVSALKHYADRDHWLCITCDDPRIGPFHPGPHYYVWQGDFAPWREAEEALTSRRPSDQAEPQDSALERAAKIAKGDFALLERQTDKFCADIVKGESTA